MESELVELREKLFNNPVQDDNPPTPIPPKP
jgi:hypothetical protein